MYVPAHDRESRPEVLQQFMHEHPLAALVTLGTDGALTASHLPLRLYPSLGPQGTLRGHLARANQQWQDFSSQTDALVIFQGPQAYISPSWYAAKQETGRVVPTWNYLAVHARGPMTIIEDPEWLRRFVTELTESHEAEFAHPWHVSDAPSSYVEGLLRAIVGIEIPIHHLEGRWKLSQNRSATDQAGVVQGLHARGDAALAKLVDERPDRT